MITTEDQTPVLVNIKKIIYSTSSPSVWSEAFSKFRAQLA